MTTTKLIKHNIVDEIKAGIDCSSSTAILVSFMMVSGLELILPSLQRWLDNGAQIKILTGDYLYITQPDALERLVELEDDIELRLWKSHGVSFHPKAYLFESNQEKQVIVGSSNLSKSALTTGVEWNVSIEQQGQTEIYEEAEDSFLQLFYASQFDVLSEDGYKVYFHDQLNNKQTAQIIKEVFRENDIYNIWKFTLLKLISQLFDGIRSNEWKIYLFWLEIWNIHKWLIWIIHCINL